MYMIQGGLTSYTNTTGKLSHDSHHASADIRLRFLRLRSDWIRERAGGDAPAYTTHRSWHGFTSLRSRFSDRRGNHAVSLPPPVEYTRCLATHPGFAHRHSHWDRSRAFTG